MGSFLRHWWKGTRGATAVEFSMVGIPFVLMTIGTIEMALVFTKQSVLQEATFSAARLIRTGQLQQSPSGGQEEMFRDAVCDFTSLVIPCDQIQFQVSEVPSFADADEDPPQFDEDGNLVDTSFDAGTQNSVVVVRVVYNYHINTPMMQPLLQSRDGGVRTMMSTMVLQTEPYQKD